MVKVSWYLAKSSWRANWNPQKKNKQSSMLINHNVSGDCRCRQWKSLALIYIAYIYSAQSSALNKHWLPVPACYMFHANPWYTNYELSAIEQCAIGYTHLRTAIQLSPFLAKSSGIANWNKYRAVRILTKATLCQAKHSTCKMSSHAVFQSLVITLRRLTSSTWMWPRLFELLMNKLYDGCILEDNLLSYAWKVHVGIR